MITITHQLSKAIEIAAAFVEHDVRKRQYLNPETNPEETWAGISLDGRIVIGTPLLHAGQGLYVDYLGHCTEA